MYGGALAAMPCVATLILIAPLGAGLLAAAAAEAAAGLLATAEEVADAGLADAAGLAALAGAGLAAGEEPQAARVSRRLSSSPFERSVTLSVERRVSACTWRCFARRSA